MVIGTYALATACPLCEETDSPLLPYAYSEGFHSKFPRVAGTSTDGGQVFFESLDNLTSDSNADAAILSPRPNVYVSDHGVTKFVGLVPASGSECVDPACVPAPGGAIPGQGTRSNALTTNPYTPHVISADGSRVIFTAEPTNCGGAPIGAACGAIYRRDLDAGPTTVRVNVSERSTPDPSANELATYWDASADASRVFFTTQEMLTDDDPNSFPDLYMWDENPNSEVQQLSVEAGGGTYTLSFRGESTIPLAFDASAGDVGSAINALPATNGAGGSVSVTGVSPMTLSFEGALAHADVPQVTIDDSALVAPTLVSSVEAIHGGHLTRISVQDPSLGVETNVEIVVGVGESGHDVYFTADHQLIAGQPEFSGVGKQNFQGLFLWHDGSAGPAGGELRYIGNIFDNLTSAQYGDFGSNGVAGPQYDRHSRLSVDGKHLLFMASDGKGLLSLHGGVDYDHGNCDASFLHCRELYLYNAETDDLRCVSCRPDGLAASKHATVNVAESKGFAASTSYLNHPLSEDGRYVFFSTAEALVEADSNGISDAYQYDAVTGENHLLSSGQSVYPSYFMDASTDGRDAFIATRERPIGWDTDKAYDVYDVRIEEDSPSPRRRHRAVRATPAKPAPVTLNDSTPGSMTLSGSATRGQRSTVAKGPRSSASASSANANAHSASPDGRRTASTASERPTRAGGATNETATFGVLRDAGNLHDPVCRYGRLSRGGSGLEHYCTDQHDDRAGRDEQLPSADSQCR